MRKHLLLKLTALALVVTLLAVGVATFFVSLYSQRALRANLEEALRTDLQLLRMLLEEESPLPLQQRVEKIGAEVGRRITVIDRDGVVVADSSLDPALFAESYEDRPEVRQAQAGDMGFAERESAVTDQVYFYAALAYSGGVVRIAADSEEIFSAFGTVLQSSLVIILAVALLTFFVAYVVNRQITDPVNDLLLVTKSLQAGEFGRRVLVRTGDEIGLLGKAFNDLSQTLEKMFDTIEDREGKLNAVLSSMSDGVLAVNMQRKVILANRTVAETTGLSEESLIGRDQVEVIRNLELANILNETLLKEVSVNREIRLYPNSDRTAAVTSSPLKADDGTIIGAVAVLRDVTNLRKLEKMRQEFVANVSHELRTPITSIKGFVETLLNSDLSDKDIIERFLRIVNGETDRMITLINDLLDLSRIESGKQAMKFEPTDLHTIFQSTMDVLQSKAEIKNIHVANRIPEGTFVLGDAKLLKQVAMNLLDNGIKYNHQGGSVWAGIVEKENDIIEVTVEDNGVGIPDEHLHRVFERFYRVDKGRSRHMGGTGLGLSIVKHIVEKHKGRIWAESTAEGGTKMTFTLRLANKEKLGGR